MSESGSTTRSDGWRAMASAPKDGSRILVTVKPAEQGAAEVDVAFWGRADAAGAEGWRSADSHPGCVILYADTELKCWMPMPSADGALRPGSASSRPRPFEGEAIEVDGSGI